MGELSAAELVPFADNALAEAEIARAVAIEFTANGEPSEEIGEQVAVAIHAFRRRLRELEAKAEK